ncbi:PRC-barrel domain-containing protein [Streptomyces sp. HMX87]|uniref:PRC-barrel domain-containing protein n=1 Tax=Streptomyces sp. HMX87 TaxID=3390849 RepID=UPI003A846AF2
MMLFSQVSGLPVVTLTEAAQLGTVASLTVDARSGALTHVRVRGRRPRKETVLAWDAVHAIGPDAVLVRSAAAAESAPPRHDLPGSRVLTETGDAWGTVQDVAFDPESGRVLTILTTRGELPGDRMLGLGDHALVVRDG